MWVRDSTLNNKTACFHPLLYTIHTPVHVSASMMHRNVSNLCWMVLSSEIRAFPHGLTEKKRWPCTAPVSFFQRKRDVRGVAESRYATDRPSVISKLLYKCIGNTASKRCTVTQRSHIHCILSLSDVRKLCENEHKEETDVSKKLCCLL